jgi:magnesium transporter
MLYVSQLQGKQVWDAWGALVGHCTDVLIGGLDQPFPPLRALAVRDGETAFIAAEQISGLFPSIILSVPRAELWPYAPHGDELWLIDRVLDRQIVDTEGRRVVRVNDLQLARVRDRFCLTGVDVGGLGLLRRLGVERPVRAAFHLARRVPPEGVIPWEDVAPLQQQDPLRLRISRERISKMAAVDIAAILNDLDHQTGQALITSLDDEMLADAMEEISPDMQVAVLSQLEPERAADVLEEMGPDEAADLLSDLPAHASQQLLELMEDDDAQDVRHLLRYPEDSAGGIMTTEFATVPLGLRAGQALDFLRRSEDAREDEAMYDVYVVDDERCLQGVITLRDLVMAPPDWPLDVEMDHEPITVEPYTLQDQVAYLAAKYNLLSVPVVDQAGSLLGIVTIDDALDAVLPTAWKKRIPRFY